MKPSILSLALLVGALALGVSPAHAVVIDFESLMHVDVAGNGHGTSYSEDGFTLSASGSGLGTFGTLHSWFTGSTALFNYGDRGVTELTLTGDGSFSLVSIDLAEFTAAGVREVSFIGFVSGGGTIAQTFALDGVAFGAETFTFPSFIGWDNITKVSWTGHDSRNYQFDNIVASANNGTPVPEPASLGLLGLGLAGLAWARRGARAAVR